MKELFSKHLFVSKLFSYIYPLFNNKMFDFVGVTLPFPDMGGTLTLEVILLVITAFIEGFRLFFGKFQKKRNQ